MQPVVGNAEASEPGRGEGRQESRCRRAGASWNRRQEQEWASKDRHDVGRRRQVEFTDRMADDRCATGDEHAFDGRVTQTQFALHGEQVLVGQFDLEVTDMPFDLLQGGLLPLDAVGGCADGIFQRRERAGSDRRYGAGGFGSQLCDAATDLSMNGVNLVQNRRGLTMEAQDMDLAVDAFCDGDNRFVKRAAGEVSSLRTRANSSKDSIG